MDDKLSAISLERKLFIIFISYSLPFFAIFNII